VHGETVEQPHFQPVIVQLVAIRDIVGVVPLVAINVNAKNIGYVSAQTMKSAVGDGVVFGVGGPLAVELGKGDASLARRGHCVDNPDALLEFIHIFAFLMQQKYNYFQQH